MTSIIPKNAIKTEMKKAIAEFERMRKNKKNKSCKGNVVNIFGSNPAEVDGREFLKKTRAAWD